MITIVNCLAARFSELLGRELGAGRLQQVVSANRAQPSGPCASRDLCPADRLMTAAFRSLMQRNPFASSLVDTDLMERAWLVARRAGFDAEAIREGIRQDQPGVDPCGAGMRGVALQSSGGNAGVGSVMPNSGRLAAG